MEQEHLYKDEMIQIEMNEELYEPIPLRLQTILAKPPVYYKIKLEHAWNENDSSENITVQQSNPLVMKRNFRAQSTDCIRGKVGYISGMHVWKIFWPKNCRGTHPVIGVATKDAPLHCDKYKVLVGSNSESWGWDLNTNIIYHNHDNNNIGVYYPGRNFEDDDSILVILDMDNGTLAFKVGDDYLGVAFTGLEGKILYPIVNVVWGNGEVAMEYINGVFFDVIPLKVLCKNLIRNAIGDSRLSCVESELCLPKILKDDLLSDHNLSSCKQKHLTCWF